uniref:Uncharacterized protein n=1 Tax=Medicago truncatula TaxID=3880 RepID=I3SV50_MEDTR|nr:unknown [Medicago truncatula]
MFHPCISLSSPTQDEFFEDPLKTSSPSELCSSTYNFVTPSLEEFFPFFSARSHTTGENFLLFSKGSKISSPSTRISPSSLSSFPESFL